MFVDDNTLSSIWKIVGNRVTMLIIKKMDGGNSYTYMEIKNFVDEAVNDLRANSTTAYYVRLMKGANIIKLDKPASRYFLTRIGVQILQVIKQFEDIAKSYDIADCERDGKIKIKTRIVGRKP